MRVGYVAKHDSGGNDDEGAITFALEKLGCNVQRLREHRGYRAQMLEVDFVLFHHWRDYAAIREIRRPKVFWCFDLIDYPDPHLRGRCRERLQWMRELIPLVDLGFLTDGDFVARDGTGKLHWLPQGADERIVGKGQRNGATVSLLFTGIGRGGGMQRLAFVQAMESHYGSQFQQVQRGIYRERLRDLIAAAQIVLAPAGPVTDRYWSNRIYNACGFGAFLLHPWSDALTAQYQPDKEVVYYRSLEELHQQIAASLKMPSTCQEIAEAALQRTCKEHLYRHRCERLLSIVGEKLRG